MCSLIGQNTPGREESQEEKIRWGSECINKRWRMPQKGGSHELEVIESEEQ